MIIDFIRLLCWHRFASKLLTPDSALWKLDVSAAFKVLVMSRDWQARQGITIKRRLPNGDLVTWYHIEWRGVFGCRAMPCLWTRFMSLVVWITQQSYGIEYPLAYMDDAFRVDLTGTLVPFVHDGVDHLIPLQQAQMASLWTSLGLPLKLSPDKAPFGRQVTITGIDCDLDLVNSSLERALSDPLLDYNRLCFLAMLALGFSACARSGELTLPDTMHFRDAEKLPDRDSVVISGSGFQVHLPYHKADRRWRGSSLQVVTGATGPHFSKVLSLCRSSTNYTIRHGPFRLLEPWCNMTSPLAL